MSRKMQQFTVHVFRPSGYKLGSFCFTCTRADVAVNRAKQRVYRLGHLAHFYTYVPTSN